MNKCPKCGYEIGENHKYCTNCGVSIDNEMAKLENYKIEARKLMNINWFFSGISLIMVICFMITNSEYMMYSLLFLTAMLVTIVVARIKYGKLKYVRVSFKIEIAFIILLYCLFVFMLFWACDRGCRGFSSLG